MSAIVFTCQHGTIRQAYATPTDNCEQHKRQDCEWKIVTTQPLPPTDAERYEQIGRLIVDSDDFGYTDLIRSRDENGTREGTGMLVLDGTLYDLPVDLTDWLDAKWEIPAKLTPLERREWPARPSLASQITERHRLAAERHERSTK